MSVATVHIFSFRALGCPNEIQLGRMPRAAAETLFSALRAEVERIERKYSRYLPSSVTTAINSAAGVAPTALDAETAGLLRIAAACYEQSGGMFDLTSGVLRRAWDFKLGRCPEEKEVRALLPLIGWDKMQWNDQSVFLPLPGMEIDFGALGKEYLVDRLTGLCVDAGAESALINLGGDVRVCGSQPDGSPWQIGISHPRRVKSVLCSVGVRNGSVATSGDYERYMIVDGIRYSHLLSPETGYPVSGFQSVTVLGESCLLSGALATMAMLLGERRGRELLKRSAVPYILVDSSGKVTSRPANVSQKTTEEFPLC